MPFDGLEISFVSRYVNYQLQKDYELELVDHTPRKKEGNAYATCDIKGIHVKLYEPPCLRVKLRGSIPVFFYGDNGGHIKLKGAKKAILAFAETFYVNPSWRVLQKVEVGVNIPVSNPKEVIDAAVLFANRTSEPMDRDGYYGKQWVFPKYYTVKLYKKNESTVRFEIRLEDLTKFKSLKLTCLADLYNPDRYIRCCDFLLKYLERFVFVPKLDRRHQAEKKLFKWGDFRSSSFWSDCSSDQKVYYAKRVDELRKLFGLKDWKAFMIGGVVAEFANMLYTDEASLSAAISDYRLSSETAADLIRCCGRPKDNKPLSTSFIFVYPMAYDIRYNNDVTIYPRSYVPYSARGPPFPPHLHHLGVFK